MGTRGTLAESVQIQTIIKGEQKKSFRIKKRLEEQ
jgi:hypothetical protein